MSKKKRLTHSLYFGVKKALESYGLKLDFYSRVSLVACEIVDREYQKRNHVPNSCT